MASLEHQAFRKPSVMEGLAKVERLGKRFLVRVGEESFEAEKVILATGMEDIQPPFPNFRALRARGLFAVGDCVNTLAQVSVAAGHAAIAATRVHNELGLWRDAL